MQKLSESLQEKLNLLVQKDLQALIQTYQNNETLELNPELQDIQLTFHKIEEVFKSEYYLSQVSETCQRILNFSVLKIDLKNTDNIKEKYRFKGVERNFNSLLKIYFELNWLAKVFIESVDLKKFDNQIPKPISKDHLESQGESAELSQEGILAAAGLDITALGDSLELTSTFSYLGEQIWNFIEFYNKITQNNNFEGFQQYINMIPGLVGLDPSVPSLKRKQFINL